MSWNIDPAHSQLTFSARHMMIMNVRGRFEDFTGTVHFDEETPANSSVDVRIEAGSINTNNSQRDEHLKSPDFLNVEQYPYLTFSCKRIETVDDNHGRIIGDLTIRDVTKEVVLETEYHGQATSPWGTTQAGFNVHTNREANQKSDNDSLSLDCQIQRYLRKSAWIWQSRLSGMCDV